jgi:hypothetical protein
LIVDIGLEERASTFAMSSWTALTRQTLEKRSSSFSISIQLDHWPFLVFVS